MMDGVVHGVHDRRRATALSVAICTHDPRADYLARTLASLRAQSLGTDHWELIVVDNASTTDVAMNADIGWQPRARVVREDRIGLTMARLCAISETTGELLLFVDDDNVLAPDYLERVLRLAAEHPRLGCFGSGAIRPEFEEEPSVDLLPYTDMLALRVVPQERWSNAPDDDCIPWGAGMVVRRHIAQAYLRSMEASAMRRSLDRKGGILNSGGDDEFSWATCDMGLGKGIFPELGLLHLIGRERVQYDYLIRLAEGHAYSHAVLAHLHGRPLPRPKRPKPRLASMASHLLHGRWYLFFTEGRDYFERRATPPVVLAFKEANERGIERFRKGVVPSPTVG